MSASQREILAAIKAANWPEIVDRLVLFTTVWATHPTRQEGDDVSTPMLDIANIVDQRFDMSSSTLNQVREDALKCVHDDPLLFRIVQVMIDEGLEKPRDIAERLDVSCEEIYKAKRRLKDRLKELRGEDSGG